MLGRIEYRSGYYRIPVLREALNELARRVFGLDFTPWNDLGYDSADYTPFSLFDGRHIVANISASPMHLVVKGKRVDVVQVGTVATLAPYRGQGLIRYLMEKAHDHWDPVSTFFFLFTDEKNVDLYRRFGYRRVSEHTFRTRAPRPVPTAGRARKLDLHEKEDRDILHRLADNRVCVSMRLGVEHDAWLCMFHAVINYPNRLLYIEPFDIVAVSKVVEDTCHLIDLIGERIPSLDEIYPFLGCPDNVNIVELGFTPDLLSVETPVSDLVTDSQLLVRGPFPLERELFRFPETGKA